VKIACIGGGPAGLYLGILVKRQAPEHEVVVYERERSGETVGYGVVFSDLTLGHLAVADAESHAAITAAFARCDDIEVLVGGEVLRSTGHGFCGVARQALLEILQARAREVGVKVIFEREVRAIADVSADVIVACDGAASAIRGELAATLRPTIDARPSKFIWLGTTRPYAAFTFLFKPTPHGLFRVHAYRFRKAAEAGRALSTFIVECGEDTWRAAGLDGLGEEATLARLTALFADELAGHRLLGDRARWRSFETVRCGRWHDGNVVLLGDAAHTAHYSVGSGTKLAMEDAIALCDALLTGHPSIPAALAAYEARRRLEVEAVQASAQASMEWFEGAERYAAMPPVQFTYSLMTRSQRLSHASVARRDPHLADGVERLLAAGAGMAGGAPSPLALPLALGERHAPSRIALAPPSGHPADHGVVGDDHLVAFGAALAGGAGVIVTEPLAIGGHPEALGAQAALIHDDHVVAWQRIVTYVHARSRALVAARIAATGAGPAAIMECLHRARFAGFDLVVLDDATPAQLAAARAHWPTDRALAAGLRDDPADRDRVVAHGRALVAAGANLLWASSPTDGAARLDAATLADRLRNELRVVTALVAREAAPPDLEAAIAAGRADLVVVERLLTAAPPRPRRPSGHLPRS
jgi:anthraniloyl-CoA monooxygenase